MMRNTYFWMISGFVLMILTGFYSCKTTGSGARETGVIREELVSNTEGTGIPLTLEFVKGKSFNHPTFAVWLEDPSGRFLQTLFVTKSYGSGTFTYGKASGNQWTPGQVRRPAALPYWSHRAGTMMGINRYIPSADQPVPDAFTGATPKGNFLLKTRGEKENPSQVKILLEINQTWDWNNFWNNNKYPGDIEYKTSCQPAVVYEATLDLSKKGETFSLVPAGRSSHNGADGNLYRDLETLTTALQIAEKITVTIGAAGQP